MRFFSLFMVALGCVASAPGYAQVSAVLHPTAVVVLRGGDVAIANGGDRSVRVYSPDMRSVKSSVSVGARPTGAVASVDGSKLFVTTFEGGAGGVSVVDVATGRVEKSVAASSGAQAPVLAGERLYVMGGFSNMLDEYDAKSLAKLRSVSVLREPSGAVVTPKYIFVANALPAMAANGDFVAAAVSVVDAKSLSVVKTIELVNGSNALRSIMLTCDGRYVLISHNLGRYTVPTSQLQQGWMNTSAVSVIDAEQAQFLGSVIVDEPNRGAAGTWGVVQAGDKLVVSHSGTHDVSVIDYQKFIDKLRSYQGGADRLAYDLRFLYGMRVRVPLNGNGPREMAVSGDVVYIPTYFSDTINMLNVGDMTLKWEALSPNRVESLAQRGERIFNDASYCYQNWQSCNGCHPGDARTDGMNWDLMNDGMGNSKNCKSLLYSIQTPPSMISGIRTSAQLANRKGFTHIQFHQIDEAEAKAVDEYVRSLEAVPSPYLVDGKLSEKAERGRKVYEKFGCGDCHSGSYYTDLKMYRIGDKVEFEAGWDTPTLREVWRTAPYLFDGRAATMRDVFSQFKHGIDKRITDKEIDELTQYVNSL